MGATFNLGSAALPPARSALHSGRSGEGGRGPRSGGRGGERRQQQWTRLISEETRSVADSKADRPSVGAEGKAIAVAHSATSAAEGAAHAHTCSCRRRAAVENRYNCSRPTLPSTSPPPTVAVPSFLPSRAVKMVVEKGHEEPSRLDAAVDAAPGKWESTLLRRRR